MTKEQKLKEKALYIIEVDIDCFDWTGDEQDLTNEYRYVIAELEMIHNLNLINDDEKQEWSNKVGKAYLKQLKVIKEYEETET